MLVSIIFPCMNEEKTVGKCIQKALSVMRRENIEGEIIVADSSTDNSREIARSLGAKIVIPDKKGYGNAYIESIKYAKGKYLILADADDTYDMNEIPKFLKPLIEDNADFIIGNRLKGDIKNGSMPWLHRYIGNPILTKLLNRLFNINIGDSHCGIRSISKEAYEKLNLQSEGMEFASELIIESARKNLRISEVPVSYYPRVTPSKLHSWGDGWRHLRFMMLYNPTPFLFVPGTLVFFLGILMMIILAMEGNIVTRSLHSFILGSLFVTIGVQMIATGSYIKIYGIIHNKIDKKGIAALLLDYHSLETGLIVGIILLVIGFTFGLGIISKWLSTGAGSLYELRDAVIFMAFISVGMQIIFSTLMISIILLDNKSNR